MCLVNKISRVVFYFLRFNRLPAYIIGSHPHGLVSSEKNVVAGNAAARQITNIKGVTEKNTLTKCYNKSSRRK